MPISERDFELGTMVPAPKYETLIRALLKAHEGEALSEREILAALLTPGSWWHQRTQKRAIRQDLQSLVHQADIQSRRIPGAPDDPALYYRDNPYVWRTWKGGNSDNAD